MSIAYILIIMLIGRSYAPAVSQQEFGSEKACEAARSHVEAAESDPWSVQAIVLCEAKG